MNLDVDVNLKAMRMCGESATWEKINLCLIFKTLIVSALKYILSHSTVSISHVTTPAEAVTFSAREARQGRNPLEAVCCLLHKALDHTHASFITTTTA